MTLHFTSTEVKCMSPLVFLPPVKVDAISKLCLDSLGSGKSGRVSLRDLAKIMGNFSRLFLDYGQFPRFLLLKGSFVNFSPSTFLIPTGTWTSCFFTPDARDDLLWRESHLRFVNSKTFFLTNPDLVIFSDVSLLGWGLFVMGYGLGDLGLWPIKIFTLINSSWWVLCLQIYTTSSSHISVDIPG